MSTAATETAIADALRSVRGHDDVLTKLKADSLEARHERIAEALAKPDWVGGPAQLVATYTHHALAEKDGTLLRVKVTEQAGKIRFDKPEVFKLPLPPADVAREVMETALVAVDRLMAGQVAEATPMVAEIANALHTSGDLRRQITCEVAKRSVNRAAWWHTVVSEHMEKIGLLTQESQVEVPAELAQLVAAADALKANLIESASGAAISIKRLGAQENLPESISVAAKDIATDLKWSIQALAQTDPGDHDELQGVFEGVSRVAPKLRLGAQFLATLAGAAQSD